MSQIEAHLARLQAAKEQLISQQSSEAFQKRPTTWLNTLDDVNECINTLSRQPLSGPQEVMEPTLKPGSVKIARETIASRYIDDVKPQDDVSYRISRALRETITTGTEAEGLSGQPLRLETALNAYQRGEYSTGQPDKEQLPAGLRSRSSTTTSSIRMRSLSSISKTSPKSPLRNNLHIHPARRPLKFQFPDSSSEGDNEEDEEEEEEEADDSITIRRSGTTSKSDTSFHTARDVNTPASSRTTSTIALSSAPHRTSRKCSNASMSPLVLKSSTNNSYSSISSSYDGNATPPPPRTQSLTFPPTTTTTTSKKPPKPLPPPLNLFSNHPHHLTPTSSPPTRPPPLPPLEALTPEKHQAEVLDALIGTPKGQPTKMAQLQEGGKGDGIVNESESPSRCGRRRGRKVSGGLRRIFG